MSAAPDPKVAHLAQPPFRKIDPDAFAARAAVIPALIEMAAIGQWLCWRPKRDSSGSRWTKPPCRPDGAICDAHDPANWRSLAECLDGVRGGPVYGVGFVTTAGDPIVLIDFDHCLEAGTLDNEIEREVKALASYAEVSVSGTGVHVIAKLDDPDRLLLDGADGGKREGVEVYRDKRFFIFTGEPLADTPDEIVEANDAVQSLWRRRVKPEGHKISGHAVDAAEIELPADLPELDQGKLQALCDASEKFRASWECRRPEPEFTKPAGGPDWSSYDQSLVNFAVWARWDREPGQIQALVYEHRQRHGGDPTKALRPGYIESTIAKARTWVAEYRAKRAAPGTDDTPLPEGGAGDPQDGRDNSQDGLALAWGDLIRDDGRHVAVWSRWLLWDGARWKIDTKLAHLTGAKKFVLVKARELVAKVELRADATKDELRTARNAAKAMRSAATIAAVVSLARANEWLAASDEQWDRDPLLLGTPAGVVDLRTGELGAAQREAFITKQTAIAPAPRGTPTPGWDRFLERIFRDDPELAPYLQRVLGYAATGRTVEQKLFLAHGEGQNGKGVLFNTAYGVLGEYSLAASGDLLLATTAIRHQTQLASLRGARLVLMSEVPDTAMWNEPLLKRLTGGDPIRANFMHQDEFTFLPSFTPVLQVNDLPRFARPTLAVQRRLELIPFEQVIPDDEKDAHLAEKLKAEWPGILRWVIDGAVAYLRDGLKPPKSVRLATQAYLAKGDLLSWWLEDCCETGPSAPWTRVSELHSHFTSWCQGRGHRSMSRMALSLRLEQLGFEKAATMRGKGFHIEIVGRVDFAQDD